MCPLCDHTPADIKNLINSNHIVSSNAPKLLPLINLKVIRTGKFAMVPFMIYTGTQASFLALDVVDEMRIDTKSCSLQKIITLNNATVQVGHAVAFTFQFPDDIKS